ncbi:hypothetical protein HN803_05765 [candidate division WWE3 bacterium]|jgi:hypothetical protein|nr:hypothetical protein [candidate division WWE3 bacterium]MBT7350264.1 hypothetical protein [candidate division WWE3 bacterium]
MSDSRLLLFVMGTFLLIDTFRAWKYIFSGFLDLSVGQLLTIRRAEKTRGVWLIKVTRKVFGFGYSLFTLLYTIVLLPSSLYIFRLQVAPLGIVNMIFAISVAVYSFKMGEKYSKGSLRGFTPILPGGSWFALVFQGIETLCNVYLFQALWEMGIYTEGVGLLLNYIP